MGFPPRAAGVLLALGAFCAEAGPALKGIWRAGELGLLELSTTGGSVVGRFRAGGACNFAVDDSVLSGTFEGGVLVGTVMVCQQGGGCDGKSARYYPLLAVSADNVFAGEVPLPKDCGSPGLVDGRRFTLAEASAADRQLAANATRTISDRLPKSKKEREQFSKEQFKKGSDYYNSHVCSRAAEAFELAIAAGYDEWPPQLLLGICRVKNGHPKEARPLLDKGLKAGGKAIPAELRNDALYAQAVVAESEGQRKEAFALLQKAITQSTEPAARIRELQGDNDLRQLRSDPEFKPFLEELEKAAAKAARKPRGG